MNKSELVASLHESINSIGKEGIKGNRGARSLRNLQSLMHHILFLKVEPQVRFLAFFLNMYVQTVFADFLGDIPDDHEGILPAIRDKYLRQVGSGLKDLTERLEKGHDTRPALEALVESYIDAVSRLNEEDLRLEGRR